jgi:hypothetical protein
VCGDDFAVDARAKMDAECKAFVEGNRADLAIVMIEFPSFRCGELFWLDRTGSGTGFWIETYKQAPEVAAALDRLSKACKKAGERWVLVNDVGEIEHS